MRPPYYQDNRLTLHHGDALDLTRELPDSSIDCVVTSPPYFGLRDYGVDGQIGVEQTLPEYIETLVDLFREVRRALSDDGTFWLNLGDTTRRKDLLMVPARVAIALQDDGWILRSDVIWNKTNAMPESVKDRPARRHEHVFLFTKARTHHFDLDPIREPHAPSSIARAGRSSTGYDSRGFPGSAQTLKPSQFVSVGGKNPGDVWGIGVRPFKGAHFAAFPPDLPRRCILAGCKPGGTVLDPFSGTGTTGAVAVEHGRKYIGFDLSAEYLDLSIGTRLRPSLI